MSEINIEYFWKQFNFSPNDQQKRAILHTEGPLYLPAGPGSGKTRVLLWRTFNLIVYQGVNPDEIFLSTFTQKAAKQLKDGLLTLLSSASDAFNRPFEINNMYIGTIHSLCQKLLQDRRLSSARERTRPPIVLDELSQFFYLYQGKGYKDVLFPEIGEQEPQMLWRRINAIFAQNTASKYVAVTKLISFFNRVSEEAPDLHAWDQRIEELSDEILQIDYQWLFKLYGHYKASLAQRPQRTDLSLLQQEAYDYLKRCDLSGSVFKHVIIDEYQDTNMVQEYIVFALARGHKNICVVGDDDQALYRFRGATVENFVQFPRRVREYLDSDVTTVPLSTNYRSGKDIVKTYSTFMNLINWESVEGEDYRVPKNIQAHQNEEVPLVYKTENDSIENCASEIAEKVRSLLDEGVVENANQIAFLFPSLGSKAVNECIKALEEQGLESYAPRAGSFLNTIEARTVFGMIGFILGEYKPRFPGKEIQDFKDWHQESIEIAEQLIKNDPLAQAFVKQKMEEIDAARKDYSLIEVFLERKKIDLESPGSLPLLRELSGLHGLSRPCMKTLNGKPFFESLKRSVEAGKPFSVRYIVNAATALDWTLLDLFYRICGLNYFKQMIEESGRDEAPLYNLSFVGQYINKYTEEFRSMITAFDLHQKRLVNSFFGSYLFTLYRRSEREFENEEDPFPKDRIPFLTIHQSKGLEFPVVVLGNFSKRNNIPDLDQKLDLFMEGKEPLEMQPTFDAMRKYYVAMSRAENLLIINNAKRYVATPFKEFMEDIPPLKRMSLETLKNAALKEEEVPQSYSFTGDFNFYNQCPMQYQIFKKFAFPPSRSQTMAFGSLVHQTIEDLHEYLIAKKEGAEA